MAEAATVARLITSIVQLDDLIAQINARLHQSVPDADIIPEPLRALSKRLPLLASSLQLILQQARAEHLPNDTIAVLQSTIQSTSTQLLAIDTYLSEAASSSGALPLRTWIEALQEEGKDTDITQTVENLHQNIDCISQQSIQHVDMSDRDLDKSARLDLGSEVPAGQRGHTFASVTAHDHSIIHLGDVYQVHNAYHPQEPDEIRGFGLCLGTAPLIEPESFIGRTTELDRMAQILQPGEPASRQQRLVLGGIGGIGKTQLAIAYARRYQACYTSVFWLNAVTQLTLKESMRYIAQRLLTRKELDRLEDEAIIQEVFRWLLNLQNVAWLMIFDNYDDPDLFDLFKYVPNSAHGSVIVTTRLPDLVRGQQMSQIRISPINNLHDNLEILEVRSQRHNIRYGMLMFATASDRWPWLTTVSRSRRSSPDKATRRPSACLGNCWSLFAENNVKFWSVLERLRAALQHQRTSTHSAAGVHRSNPLHHLESVVHSARE